MADLASERVERRLTAILAVDVAGYSQLMGADEESALWPFADVRDHVKNRSDLGKSSFAMSPIIRHNPTPTAVWGYV